MRVGWIGLGKLGLPCAVACAHRGLDVMGYDVDVKRMTRDPQPYREAGPDGTGDFNAFLAESSIRFGSLQEVVDHSELLFVAVQTPHLPEYEGIAPLPATRADFDYRALQVAVMDIEACVRNRRSKYVPTVAVVSTVLPGTIRSKILPLLRGAAPVIYVPSFIAMGTTMRDFLDPEFVLCGHEDAGCVEAVRDFLRASGIPDPLCTMGIESAELTKVAYNTFVGLKIAFANTMMEVCHKLPGCDVDDVMRTLQRANRRLISPAYLNAGMGDGGGCHPRDNIALSWLARKLGLKYDLFESLMLARERQAKWFAELLLSYHLPACVLGYAFKPGTNITTGSHALLVARFMELQLGVPVRKWDPLVDAPHDWGGDAPHVFLVGTKHEEFRRFRFPAGSVVLDPFRYIGPQDGVTVVPLGIGT